MSVLQSGQLLTRDVRAVLKVCAEWGWELQARDADAPLLVRAALTSRIDGEKYWLRLLCEGYPDEAPSILCIDPDHPDVRTRTAWPDCDGFRVNENDICLPLTREGYRLHPAWLTDPLYAWDPNGNPLLRVLEQLQLRLDDRVRYRGRVRP